MLILILGPSGAGKSEIISRLVSRTSLEYIIPDVTRALRQGETDKRFVRNEEFTRRQFEGRYIWVNTLFGGVRYGTPRMEVEAAVKRPEPSHLLDFPIEYIGRVEGLMGDRTGIVLLPPSEDLLKARLSAAGRDARVDQAVRQYRQYLHCVENALPSWVRGVVTNHDIERAYWETTRLVFAGQQPREGL